jgi:cellulose synthase/poly-beta-1,6-N-acetylglucosamine synthase-like glycosyltransferase
VLVYGGIVFLSYFSLLLLNKAEKNREDTTRLVREIAIHTGAPENARLDYSGNSPSGSEDRPFPAASNVAFLIRAYNEASRLEGVIDSLKLAGYSKILVVDDGSRDATSGILARRSDVFSIRHPQNRGGGAALETGFEFFRRYARGL